MMKSHAVGAVILAAAIIFVPGAAVRAQGDVTAEIRKEDFFREGLAPVRRPASYDLTIVYFMDYQCPSCRKYTPDVARALRDEPRVRVIYRDTPIFGPRSEAAARAAIASAFQGRHEAMHHALMTVPLPLDDAAIRSAADKAGVDWVRLQRDLRARADEISSVIDWNQHLSVQAGISGTPGFIIGNRLADGALEYADLRASIADARRDAGAAEGKPPVTAKKSHPDKNAAATGSPGSRPADREPQLRKMPKKNAVESSSAALVTEASGLSTRILSLIGVLALLSGAAALLWWHKRRKAL